MRRYFFFMQGEKPAYRQVAVGDAGHRRGFSTQQKGKRTSRRIAVYY
ncbi:MAG: hypothetical protein R2828_20800 [Saprospiraceae bacterium]